ncbi:AAA family ATPase [uncultured Thiothrix sp.]|uniref:AAA family ATPase n=1 Tax=uncultured Thiothrix sp. TaxID=223185 RepID=UPI003459EC3C
MKLKIPYGLSNFRKVISEGYTYVDKTAYIPALEEQGNYLLLLRPRRFGKSLFISMLEYYYDQRYAAEFPALFGQLAIGQQPTALQNSYQVLFMEFSGIATTSAEDIYRAFTTKIQLALERFLEDYAYPRTAIQQVQQCELPHEKMEAFFTQVRGNKLLLLIDEYDHFANSILADNLTHFQSIVGKGGFVRSFYETLKAATQRGALDRLFITGVTPVMLDSLTSGFNVVENVSLHADFNAAIGFTHQEAASLLQPLADDCGLSLESLQQTASDWYDGYWFNSQANETLFNADMLLYFLKNFDRQRCRYSKQMLDENIASDYGKIMALFHIGNREASYQVLDELIQHGQVEAQQQRKFDLEKGLDRDDFISLLAYMGFVSLQGETLTGQIFGIPNQVIRELYFQYFKVELALQAGLTITRNCQATSLASVGGCQ